MFTLTHYPLQLPHSHVLSRGFAPPTLCRASLPDTATPLLSAVRERAERTAQAPFHIPGHKQGRGAGVLPEFLGMMGPALRHDLTELPGSCVLFTTVAFFRLLCPAGKSQLCYALAFPQFASALPFEYFVKSNAL